MRGPRTGTKMRCHALRSRISARVGTRGPADPLSAKGGRPPCHLHGWAHVPLEALAKLPRRLRFVSRHCFPLHRHGRKSTLCVPPAGLLKEALRDYNAVQFHFTQPEPGTPFESSLCANMQAYADANEPLGSAWSIQQLLVLSSVSPPHAIPFVADSPIPCFPADDNLSLPGRETTPQPTVDTTPPPDPSTHILTSGPAVFTYSGWRPKVGGFRRQLPMWQRHHHLFRPFVLAVITHGAFLHWAQAPPPPLWLKNHHMSVENRVFVSKELAALRLTGAIVPYDTFTHGLPHFIGPLHVSREQGRDPRLIWDPRYINSYIGLRTMKLESLQSLSVMLDEASLMLKVDLKGGYHHITMAPQFSRYLVFEWEGQLYRWVALPFGLSSAPFIFESVMKGLKTVFRLVFRVKLLGYLDDFAFILPADRFPLPLSAIVAGACRLLCSAEPIPQDASTPIHILALMVAFGATIHLGKFEFNTCIEMLGIVVDSVLRRFSIPARRWLRLKSLLEQLLTKARVPLRLLAKAAGSLVSMADGLRHAKTLMWSVTHTIQSHLAARPGSWHQHIQVPDAVKASCTMWLDSFHRFNGISLDRPPDRVLVWDACKYGSGGAALNTDGSPIALAHLDTPIAEREAHNNVKELGAAVDVSIPLLGHFAHRRVVLKGDNVTALSYIRRGGGKSRLCTAIAQGLLSLFIAFDVDIVSVLHIPGPQNWLADRLSRFRDQRGDWAIKQSALHLVKQWIAHNQFPPFNVDAFASHLNHICPTFCSRFHELDATFVDFFQNDFADPDLVLWCNPPFSLLMRVLGHIQHLHCPTYVVAPDWQQRDWWVPLQQRARGKLCLPPAAFTSVMSGHRWGYRAPPYQIHVYFLGVPGVYSNHPSPQA